MLWPFSQAKAPNNCEATMQRGDDFLSSDSNITKSIFVFSVITKSIFVYLGIRKNLCMCVARNQEMHMNCLTFRYLGWKFTTAYK